MRMRCRDPARPGSVMPGTLMTFPFFRLVSIDGRISPDADVMVSVRPFPGFLVSLYSQLRMRVEDLT